MTGGGGGGGGNVAAISLKFEIRLHAHPVGMKRESGTEFYLIGLCIRN